jgi:SAM-dependent methyltransferase
MADYLNVVYDEKSHPKNSYPDKLVGYLFKTYGLCAGQRILEPGCGRGEFLDSFRKLGMECHGIDLSPQAGSLLEDIKVKQADLEKDRLPYEDNFFDVVYNKSLMEHLWNPDEFLHEAHRILKPGGLLLCLVPDWESNYKIYFDDFTHRTPFTKVALNDILLMCNFKDVNVIKFRQLPIVWKYPALNILCSIIAPFVPVRAKTKFFRWSRELMLAGSGRKPVS